MKVTKDRFVNLFAESDVSFPISEPVSLSRARTMRYDDSPGHLKFAKHAVMKIIAKNVGGREDLWEAEVVERMTSREVVVPL